MPLPIGTDQRLERTPWVTIGIMIVTSLNYSLPIIDVPLFLHADISHLFGNMLYLWIFGSYVEDRVGSGRFLLYYILCEFGSELLGTVVFDTEGIGASGAISGVLALYLARCHYSKIRTIINVGFVFFRLDINAKWLIGLWFLKNLFKAVFGYTEIELIGYWAHIGGFLAGLIIAYWNNYYLTGKKEELLRKANMRMESRKEFNLVEKDLRKAIALDPDDPEPHLMLARHYARREENDQAGREEYMFAARSLYRMPGEEGMAGRVYREYADRYGASKIPVEELFKYAGLAHAAGDVETATGLLSPLLHQDKVNGIAGRKALTLLNTCATQAGDGGVAERARKKFSESFPDSKPLPILSLPVPIAEEPVTQKSVFTRQISAESIFAKFRQWVDDRTSQPAFWVMWMTFFSIQIFILSWLADEMGNAFYLLILFMSAVLALVGTGLTERSVLIPDLIFGRYHKSQLQADRDFIESNSFNRGMAAERDEKYIEAVDLFKEVLEVNPEHFEARFRLARIYHRNLKRKGSAIYEYEKLLELLPDGASYSMAAKDGLAELRGERPAPEPIKPLEWKE